MSAPTEIPIGFKHVSKPKPPAVEPLPQDGIGFDPADVFGEKPISDEQAAHNKRVTEAYEAERQWKLQDDRDREAQWRYTWADSMLAARGHRSWVDDVTQIAQGILPALLQAHATRAGSDDDDAGDDLWAHAQINGWGAPGPEVSFNDDGPALNASYAESVAFDALLLAEALLDVRKHRYGC